MSIASLFPAAGVSTQSNALHLITALRYRLCSGPVDLSPLVVRQVRHFTWGHASVSTYILGASHALMVTLPDGRIFTELLTCLPPDNAQEGTPDVGEEWCLPETMGGQWEKEIAENGFLGTVRVHHVALADGTDRFIGDYPSANTLHEPFPLPTGETAWTRVAWQTDSHRLFLETLHTYPEAGAMIRSTTILRSPDSMSTL